MGKLHIFCVVKLKLKINIFSSFNESNEKTEGSGTKKDKINGNRFRF